MGNATWMQEKLLLNLAGKESIIGKSLTFFTMGTAMDENAMDEDEALDEVAGCCVIGQSAAAEPTPAPPAPTNPW